MVSADGNDSHDDHNDHDDHDDHLGNSNMVSADDDDDQNPPPHDHHGDHLQVRAIGSHYEKLAQVSVL